MLRSLSFSEFINPPVWSLYVEVVFYLVLPAFVIAARGRIRTVDSRFLRGLCAHRSLRPTRVHALEVLCRRNPDL